MTTAILSSNDIKGLTNHVACLNLAADYIERANEERNLAKVLFDRIENLVRGIIAILGILTAATLGALLASSILPATTTLISPILYVGFLGVGTIVTIALPILMYQVYQRSLCLDIARNFEQQATIADLRAAEIPSYKDYGIFSRLIGSLFHIGNPVSRFGVERAYRYRL